MNYILINKILKYFNMSQRQSGPAFGPASGQAAASGPASGQAASSGQAAASGPASGQAASSGAASGQASGQAAASEPASGQVPTTEPASEQSLSTEELNIIKNDLINLMDDFQRIINFNDTYDIIVNTNGDNQEFNLCYMLINNIQIPNITNTEFLINYNFNVFCIKNEEYILGEILDSIESINSNTYKLFANIVKTYDLKKKIKSNSVIVKLILCFRLYSKKYDETDIIPLIPGLMPVEESGPSASRTVTAPVKPAPKVPAPIGPAPIGPAPIGPAKSAPKVPAAKVPAAKGPAPTPPPKVPTPKVPEPKSIEPDKGYTLEKTEELQNCYVPGARPPNWSITGGGGHYKIIGDDEWKILAKKVKVYITGELDVIKLLVTRREPVNITMKNYTHYYYYNKYIDFLKKYGLNPSFAYAFENFTPEWQTDKTKSQSAYSFLYQQKNTELPPNFAMYIRTPIKNGGNEEYKLINVINCIGFAFDSVEQPDFKYFTQNETLPIKFKLNKEEEFKKKLVQTFNYIFQCALEHNLNTIMLSYIGGSAFSTYYPNKDFNKKSKLMRGGPNPTYTTMYVAAFKIAFNSVNTKNPSIITKIVLMGQGDGINSDLPIPDIDKTLSDYANSISLNYECPQNGLIPQICFNDKYNPDNCLYVNAWDPHSIVGNGNEADGSLDGRIGRVTAMAYLSFPFINNYLINNKNDNYVKVDEVDIPAV